MQEDKLQLKRAAHTTMASLLNLTVLPGIGFIVLLYLYYKATPGKIDHYYAVLSIKLNVLAAVALFVVCALMILLGGFESVWTWVYVISYFVFVHALFILSATWVLVRSWTGERLKGTLTFY